MLSTGTALTFCLTGNSATYFSGVTMTGSAVMISRTF